MLLFAGIRVGLVNPRACEGLSCHGSTCTSTAAEKEATIGFLHGQNYTIARQNSQEIPKDWFEIPCGLANFARASSRLGGA